MNRFKELHKQADEILNDLRSLKKNMRNIGHNLTNGGTVTYEQLIQIKQGDPFEELEGIISYRVFDTIAGYVFLFVEMKAGSEFTLHDHDCLEFGHIISGQAYVNNVSMSTPDDFQFQPYSKHQFQTTGGCNLIVAFKKPD